MLLKKNTQIGQLTRIFFFLTAAIPYYVSDKRLKILLTSVTAVNGLFLWHLIRLQLIPDINFPLIKDTIMFCKNLRWQQESPRSAVLVIT